MRNAKELREAADNACAALETVLAHYGPHMPAEDQQSRTEACARLRTALDVDDLRENLIWAVVAAREARSDIGEADGTPKQWEAFDEATSAVFHAANRMLVAEGTLTEWSAE